MTARVYSFLVLTFQHLSQRVLQLIRNPDLVLSSETGCLDCWLAWHWGLPAALNSMFELGTLQHTISCVPYKIWSRSESGNPHQTVGGDQRSYSFVATIRGATATSATVKGFVWAQHDFQEVGFVPLAESWSKDVSY